MSYFPHQLDHMTVFMAPELRGGISYLQELVSSSAYEEIVRTERVITEAHSPGSELKLIVSETCR